MIRIIKPGKVKRRYKTIYTTECPFCDCEFEFGIEDVDNRPKTLTLLLTGTIECPYCKVLLKTEELDGGHRLRRRDEPEDI